MTEQQEFASGPNAPRQPVETPSSKPLRHRRIGATAVLALAALVGLVVWFVVESRNSTPSQPATEPAVAVTLAKLKSLARASTNPIYWVGPNSRGGLYELTRSATGTYLRYLPEGAAAGDSRPLRTVAAFTVRNAYGVTKKAGNAPGSASFETAGRGIAVYGKKNPTTIYVAYAGSRVQLEIYDPDVASARQIAATDAIRPVLSDSNPAANANIKGPVATTPAQLTALATQLGHPIYWVGPKVGTTYELTETSNHFVLVRYLPAGVAVRTAKPYLTVATYPLKNAFAVTSRTSKSAGTGAIAVAGGIGAYSKQHPTHAYVAYKGVDVQIEIYDPSPTVPRKLIAAGRVVPVG